MQYLALLIGNAVIQPSSKKAALIELGGSHDINLYSQLLFLRHGGYHTTLIVDERVHRQVQFYDNVDVLMKCAVQVSFLSQLKELWRIRNYIIDNKVQIVVFNTANGPLIRTLTLMPFNKNITFAGTLHSLHKLRGSITQDIISRRVKKYFVLAEYLKKKARNYGREDLQFEAFYPMYYMKFPNETVVHKPANELWIGIPGVVEYVRKDYKGLAYALAALKEKLPVKFLLLGSAFHKSGDGHDFKQLLKQQNLEDYFLFWEGYVSNEDFHGYLKQCDMLMPLIHPKKGDKNVYMEYQISGTWNLAFAYKKPLLFAKEFAELEDFKDYGIFYDLETLTRTLRMLPYKINQHCQELYEKQQWQFEFQANRYLHFLEN